MTMIGVETHDSSVVNVFDIVLGENISDGEYNGIEDERHHHLLSRNSNRKVSRKYVRPIFKEPGSKMKKANEMPFDQRPHVTIPMKLKRTSANVPHIACPATRRIQNDSSPTIYKDDGDLFQSSLYHTSRLEYIVGNPIERHELKGRNKPVTLRSGLVQRCHQERLSHLHYVYNNPNIEGPIASPSDIDVLEAKILRPKIASTKEGGQLNILRREINRIVSDSVDEEELEGRNGLPRIFDIVEYEEREGYEGCASHGCAGFLESGNELQDLINDMKEYWTS